MIGCAIHRLNLAVNKYLQPFEPMLYKIPSIMLKLKSLKRSANLRKKHLYGEFSEIKRLKQTHAKPTFRRYSLGEMVISPNAISPKVISPNVFGHFA